jgi:pimeloyl-ACP methyl ester carboxylesterase
VERRSRLAVALLSVLVLATGCTLPSFAPEGSDEPARPGGLSTPGTASGTQWKPCPDVPRELLGKPADGMSYDCATVQVPRDWAAPAGGETYGIEMIRVRSKKQKQRIGSLLMNPGGPGGSGIDVAVYLSYGPGLGGLPTEITDRFDLVGFDPRGVGKSDPVKCISPDD